MKYAFEYLILLGGFACILHMAGVDQKKTLVIDNQEVAKVISAEACGEGERGMQAVANTIYNRSVMWNKSLDEIIKQKNQYYGYTASNKEELYRQCSNEAYPLAKNISTLEDITGGAVYFLQDGERKGSWIGEKTVKDRTSYFLQGENKMKTVHVVQEVVGGCAYEPVIFLDVKQADKHFIKLVKEVFHVDCADIKEALEYVRDVESDDYHDLFYWELPLLEGKRLCQKTN